MHSIKVCATTLCAVVKWIMKGETQNPDLFFNFFTIIFIVAFVALNDASVKGPIIEVVEKAKESTIYESVLYSTI